jgi:hypothetical protein
MPANIDTSEKDNESHTRIMEKKAPRRYGILRQAAQHECSVSSYDTGGWPAAQFAKAIWFSGEVKIPRAGDDRSSVTFLKASSHKNARLFGRAFRGSD